MTIDIVDGLRGIGLCAAREALLALLAHATKSRLSPAEVAEQIVRLERRERDARNLASRTRRATLGAMKPPRSLRLEFPPRHRPPALRTAPVARLRRARTERPLSGAERRR